MQNLQLVQEAAQELYKNKAGQIVALDVQGMTVICDYMLIAAGRTVNQVKALADDVDERMAELGVPIRRREGQNEGRWIILDYGFMLVHIFHTEEYEYYNLERCGRMAATALCCRLTRRICNRIQKHRAVRVARSLPDVVLLRIIADCPCLFHRILLRGKRRQDVGVVVILRQRRQVRLMHDDAIP